VIEPGDILLLLAPADRAEDVVAWLGGMVLADRGLSVTQETKTWAAIASSPARSCWRRWA
jgi:hypothetical protein